jgi:DNA-directed RNA polymerase subunit RPC12/RpoP
MSDMNRAKLIEKLRLAIDKKKDDDVVVHKKFLYSRKGKYVSSSVCKSTSLRCSNCQSAKIIKNSSDNSLCERCNTKILMLTR